MAFGMNANATQPVAQEKVSPMSKLQWKPKGKKLAHEEAKETPAMEARNHPKSFLQRAAKLAK